MSARSPDIPPLDGVFAAMAAVAIWAGWLILVRADAGKLAPADMALLRYGAPALLLAPVWLRCRPLPRGLSPGRLAVMALGWGAPFALLGAQGAQAGGEVALFAAMTPGTMPLWLALIAAALSGARPRGWALAGLGMMVCAAAAALWSAPPGSLPGAPWFLAAAIGWAGYAAAFRGSGLTPLQATALVGLWSTLGLILAAPFLTITLHRLHAGDLATQIGLHGVLSGVISVLCFAYAIQRLGAVRAGAFAALVPLTAGLGGWVLLGERPGLVAALALGLASLGAALASGVRFRRPA